jgi:DNA-binding MurR/RpiR family transcriptional regulator
LSLSEAELPPRDFEGLKAALIARRGTWPARLAQVAEYAVANPDEIAFGTAASIARAAGVQPSTLVRFAQTVGYSGFSAFQEVFRHRLRTRSPDHRQRLVHLRAAEGEHGTARLLDRFSEAAMASLWQLREGDHAATIAAAAELLAQAEIVHLVGLKRAFPVAAYLFYALSKLGIRAVLVDHTGGLGAEQGAGVRAGDALLAVSFTPYTTATVALADAAARAGIPVVAITDSPFSPLAPAARVRIDVTEADVSGFRSFAATFCLATTLAVAIGECKAGE